MLRSFEVAITTIGDQTGTNYGGQAISGEVVGIKYEFGTLANTADFDITGETSGSLILNIDNVAAADTFWVPRVLGNKHTDGSAFTDSGVCPRLYGERVKIVTAQGGASKTGTMTFYVKDDSFFE